MSRTSTRHSTNRSARATYDEFDPEVSFDEYKTENLQQLASKYKIPGRSTLKEKIKEETANKKKSKKNEKSKEDQKKEDKSKYKKALFDLIKTTLEERAKQAKKDAVTYAATGGHNVKDMSTKQLKVLAGDSELNIPDRSKAKNHDDYVKLITDFYAEGKHKEPKKAAPKSLTKFDPEQPVTYYTKSQLYDFGISSNLPVTRGMNLNALYDTLIKGENRQEKKEREKRMSETRFAAKAPGIEGMQLKDLRAEAKKRFLTGYSKLPRGELIDMIKEYDEGNQASASKSKKTLSNSERFEEESKQRKSNSRRSSGDLTGVYASRPLPEYNFLLDDAFAALSLEEPSSPKGKGKAKQVPVVARPSSPVKQRASNPIKIEPVSPPQSPKGKGKAKVVAPTEQIVEKVTKPKETAKKPAPKPIIEQKKLTKDQKKEMRDRLSVQKGEETIVMDLYIDRSNAYWGDVNHLAAILHDKLEKLSDEIQREFGIDVPTSKDLMKYYLSQASDTEEKQTLRKYFTASDGPTTGLFSEDMDNLLSLFANASVPLFDVKQWESEGDEEEVLTALYHSILVPFTNVMDSVAIASTNQSNEETQNIPIDELEEAEESTDTTWKDEILAIVNNADQNCGAKSPPTSPKNKGKKGKAQSKRVIIEEDSEEELMDEPYLNDLVNY